MHDHLILHPDTPFHFTEDVDTQPLLHSLGLFQQFPRQPHLAVPRCESATEMFRHPTHYIVAIKLSGFHNSSENGFIVECLPKSKSSPADVLRLLKLLESNFTPGGHRSVQNVRNAPGDN